MLGSEYGQPGLYMLAAEELFNLQVLGTSLCSP